MTKSWCVIFGRIRSDDPFTSISIVPSSFLIRIDAVELGKNPTELNSKYSVEIPSLEANM